MLAALPLFLSATGDKVPKPVGDGPLGIFHRVAVPLQREGRRAVTEPSLQRLGVTACEERQRRRRVAEVVQPYAVKPRPLSGGPPVPAPEVPPP